MNCPKCKKFCDETRDTAGNSCAVCQGCGKVWRIEDLFAEIENLNTALVDSIQACLEAVGINFGIDLADIDKAQEVVKSYGTKPSHTVKGRYEEAISLIKQIRSIIDASIANDIMADRILRILNSSKVGCIGK